MRILKQLLIGFLGLCALMFLFSLLLPTKVRISRGIVISKPVDSIADYLEHIRVRPDGSAERSGEAATFR